MKLISLSHMRTVGVRYLALTLAAAVLLVLLSSGIALAAEADQESARLDITVVTDSPDWGVEIRSEVNYEFTILNSGAVTVSDIVVVDTLCGDVGTIASLDPGESVSMLSSARIEGTGSGTATALGRDPDGGVVSGTASHSVEVFIAHEWLDYAVSFLAPADTVLPGQEIVLSVGVENLSDEPGGTGDVELKVVFDGAIAEIVDASGGVVDGSSVTWLLNGPSAEAGPAERAIRLRLRDSAVAGTSLRVDAMLLVDESRTDIDPSNDSDFVLIAVGASPGASLSTAGSVGSGSSEPFLPFTGSSPAGLLLCAAFAGAGVWLRNVARQTH